VTLVGAAAAAAVHPRPVNEPSSHGPTNVGTSKYNGRIAPEDQLYYLMAGDMKGRSIGEQFWCTV